MKRKILEILGMFVFVFLSIMTIILVLEGYKLFLDWIKSYQKVIIWSDILFLVSFIAYQITKKIWLGVVSTILGLFILLSLLYYSWNLFLLIPILGIMSIKSRRKKWKIKSIGLSSAFSDLKKWNISLYYIAMKFRFTSYFDARDRQNKNTTFFWNFFTN